MSFMPFGFCVAAGSEEEPAAPTEFTITTTSVDQVITVKAWDPGDIFLDWGDGSTETMSGVGQINTTNTYAVVGSYTLKVSGAATRFSLSSVGNYLESLDTVLQGLDITSAKDMFASCRNITAIPDDYFQSCPDIFTFEKCFYNTAALLYTGTNILPVSTVVDVSYFQMFHISHLITIDPDIIDFINPTDYPNVDLRMMFKSQNYLTGPVPDMWTAYGSSYVNGKDYSAATWISSSFGDVPSWWK